MIESPTTERNLRTPPFGAPHVVVLAVIDGDSPGQAYRLVQRETIVGRGDEADFSVEDDEISKQHFRLQFDGGICSIIDLGSLNGTLVNGRKLREGISHRIRHLDEVEIGSTRFFVLAGRYRAQRRN